MSPLLATMVHVRWSDANSDPDLASFCYAVLCMALVLQRLPPPALCTAELVSRGVPLLHSLVDAQLMPV
jgi:hypothetical protein